MGVRWYGQPADQTPHGTRAELLSERRALLAEAQKILDMVEAINHRRPRREKRDLTADEDRRWRAAHAKIKTIDKVLDTGGASQGVLAGLPDDDGGDYMGTHSGATRHSTDFGERGVELRSAGDAEAWVRSRGADERDAEGLSPGAFLRAILLGPQDARERRALAASTDTAGGFSVPDLLQGQLIDKLRARPVVSQAGARSIMLESGQAYWAQIDGDPTAVSVPENEPITESEITLGAVAVKTRSIAVLVRASRELIDDNAVNLQSALERIMTETIALKVDQLALLGDGTAGQLLGVANYPGVQEVIMLGAGNGDAIHGYEELIQATYLATAVNAPEPSASVMHPRTVRDFNVQKDGEGLPLQRPPSLVNHRLLATTQVPITDTIGSSTNATKLFTADWSQLVLAYRLGMRVETLRERYAERLQLGFIAHIRVDSMIEHPEAFVMHSGIIPAA